MRMSPFGREWRNFQRDPDQTELSNVEEDSDSVPTLLHEEGQNGRFPLRSNAERLSIHQNLLPNLQLPFLIFWLDVQIELMGKLLMKNRLRRHEEGKDALCVHEIPIFILDNQQEGVQSRNPRGVADMVRYPRLCLCDYQGEGRQSIARTGAIIAEELAACNTVIQITF